MIFCIISKKGSFSLIFVEFGSRINPSYYIESVMAPILKLYTKKIYSNQHWVFQLYSTSAHKSKIIQIWCQADFSDFRSPSNWPMPWFYLKSLVHYILGVLEVTVNTSRHNSIELLKVTLLREWDKHLIKSDRARIDKLKNPFEAAVY